MAIVPVALPSPPAPPTAAAPTGVPPVPADDALPQMREFALLLATGLEVLAGGMPAVKPEPHADVAAPDDTASQNALQAGAEPPVVAFMLASLNHPAARQVVPGAAPAATREDVLERRVTGARVTPGADAAEIARDKPQPSAGDLTARVDAASDAKAARAAEVSFADALGASALSTQAHPLAAAHAPAVAEPMAAAGIGTPVGAPGWGEELGHKLVWMAGKGEQVASLRLNPPDLGPVEIRVTLHGEQGNQATVQFASAHASVREAIQTAMPHLQAMLADSGIRLDHSSVGAESFRDQSAQRGRDGSGGDGSGQPAPATPEDRGLPRVRATGNALVDTFA